MRLYINKNKYYLLGYIISLIMLSIIYFFIDLNLFIFVCYVPLLFSIKSKKFKKRHIFIYFLAKYLILNIFINQLAFDVTTSAFLTYFGLSFLLAILQYIVFLGVYGFFSHISKFTKKILRIKHWKDMSYYMPLYFILSLICYEFIMFKGDLAFPWFTFALPMVEYFALTSTASVFGYVFIAIKMYIINFFIFICIKNIYESRKQILETKVINLHKSSLFFGVIVIILILIPLFNYFFFPYNSYYEETDLKIAVVQPNIPLTYSRYNSESFFKAQESVLNYIKYASTRSADLVIFPESIYPDYLQSNKIYLNKLKAAARENEIGVILGYPAFEKKNDIISSYNSAGYIDKYGNYNKPYYKNHLVPFGEFVPFSKKVKFLDNIATYTGLNQSRGKVGKPFEIEKNGRLFKFYPTICFEGIFSYYFNKLEQNNPDFYINISNDSWYDSTYETKHHLYLTALRASETKKMIFRSATTGISAIIDNKGIIRKHIKPLNEGMIISNLKIPARKTFYTNYGYRIMDLMHYLGWYLVFAGYFLIIFTFLKKKIYK